MIKIKAPATSANIGVGFDTLGLALSIYNTFTFEESTTYQVVGFSDAFDLDNNIVLDSYKNCAMRYLDEQDIKPVIITQIENDIPYARGLGSSASCIVAGVLAANKINSLELTDEECIAIAADIEGHSDNVYACFYGGLTASLKDNNKYLHQTFDIDQDLQFYVLIPEVTGSTKELRKVLPEKVTYNDAIFNLSRMAFVPRAFQSGDFKQLQTVLQDTLHEPYRYPFLPIYEEILQLQKRDDLIVTISGSGPSVLLISQKPSTFLPQNILQHYKLHTMHISHGVEIEVV